jgi:hypothetical protein
MKTSAIGFLIAALVVMPSAANAQCPTGQHVVVQITAGVDDNFAQPEEPAYPDAGVVNFLTGYFGNALRNFDQPGINATLAHTFYWQPTNFCSAFVTMHILAQFDGGAESNDTFSMEFNPGFIPGQISQWAWGLYIGDILGKAWVAGNEKTLTLDLLNLPPDPHNRTSVGWALADGDLDVIVDDDTVVDYVTLTLCGCETINPVQPTTWGKVKALYR